MDLAVGRGEVVTLLGRNGAGRTTTLRAIMGLTGQRQGSIRIGGEETIHLPTYKVAHHGVGYCPEERGIFASLSCEENLLLPLISVCEAIVATTAGAECRSTKSMTCSPT